MKPKHKKIKSIKKKDITKSSSPNIEIVPISPTQFVFVASKISQDNEIIEPLLKISF